MKPRHPNEALQWSQARQRLYLTGSGTVERAMRRDVTFRATRLSITPNQVSKSFTCEGGC